jgi:hypothetical protein
VAKQLPAIETTGNPDAIRKLTAAVNAGALPHVHVTDGELVFLEPVAGSALTAEDDCPLPVRAVVLGTAQLAGILAEHTYTTRTGPNGVQEWMPPVGVLSAVLNRSHWPGVATLAGIVGTPVLRRDGTLLQKPGYDPATGLYLAPTVKVKPVPARPSVAQVVTARRFLFDRLLADFEWFEPADWANYMGLMVTPFLRRYLRSLSPLGILSASMPGAGKTILTALIGLLTGQRVLPWSDDDIELRKAIGAVFASGEAAVVVWDNLAEGTVIRSPILASLLTADTWTDRILGSTRTGTWRNERLWLVTGNNLRVGGDIGRRAVLVRLAPSAPHPEQRSGFRLPDLDTWILAPAHRAQVMHALLTLVVDWCQAGAPRGEGLTGMGQFDGWARGVGGFLVHHGVNGFMSNRSAVSESDEEDLRWAAFLATWHERHGDRWRTARDVFADGALVLDDAGRTIDDPWAGTFIADHAGRRPRTAVQLGHWLAGHRDRYHDRYRLTSVLDAHTKVSTWKVQLWDGGSPADPRE